MKPHMKKKTAHCNNCSALFLSYALGQGRKLQDHSILVGASDGDSFEVICQSDDICAVGLGGQDLFADLIVVGGTMLHVQPNTIGAAHTGDFYGDTVGTVDLQGCDQFITLELFNDAVFL